MGSKWPSLAASLSLTENEIEEVRKEMFSQPDQSSLKGVKGEELPPQGYRMLKKWASRKGATYGRLRQTLKTSLLFPKEICSPGLGTNLVFTRIVCLQHLFVSQIHSQWNKIRMSLYQSLKDKY